MIDTEEYAGHTPAPWTIDIHKVGEDICAIVIESNMTTHSNCVLAEVEVENKYANADAQIIADAPLLLAEVKRLQEENKKQLDVLSTLDEMIRCGNDHVEMMKALEQGLDLSETWKEMVA